MLYKVFQSQFVLHKQLTSDNKSPRSQSNKHHAKLVFDTSPHHHQKQQQQHHQPQNPRQYPLLPPPSPLASPSSPPPPPPNRLDCEKCCDQSNQRLRSPICLTSLAPFLLSPVVAAAADPSPGLASVRVMLDYHHPLHQTPMASDLSQSSSLVWCGPPVSRPLSPLPPRSSASSAAAAAVAQTSRPLSSSSPPLLIERAIALLISSISSVHNQPTQWVNSLLFAIALSQAYLCLPMLLSLLIVSSVVLLIYSFTMHFPSNFTSTRPLLRTAQSSEYCRSFSNLYHIVFVMFFILFAISSTFASASPCFPSTSQYSDCVNSSHLTNLSSNHSISFHSTITTRPLRKRSEGFGNLHRHHHQHHPHYRNLLQQQQQQQHQPQHQLAPNYVQAYHLTRLLQAEQPYDPRSVRRQSVPSLSSSTTTTSSSVPYGLVRHIQPNLVSHSSTYLASIRRQSPYTSSSNTNASPQAVHSYFRNRPHQYQHSEPLQTCPEGPPSQWESKLDVSAKAYLAPVVFYGQLISLAEDYGGRIGATFRLSKVLKPSPHGASNHANSNSTANLASFLANTDYETHVKLYFVRNRSESLESPFCAQYMPDIFERLRTKERYILFAHPKVLASRGYTLPSQGSRSVGRSGHLSSQHHQARIHRHQHQYGQPASSNVESRSFRHIGHQLISLVTYSIPEIHNRNTSRLVRKVLCRGCAKSAVVHSSRSTLHVNARGNITLACRVEGNPIPWVEWYRNGKRLRTRRRVTINTRRRISHLTIVHASVRRDKGIYECRAMNVVSKEPSVKRFQVLVTWPSGSSRKHSSRPYSSGNKNKPGSSTTITTADDRNGGNNGGVGSGKKPNNSYNVDSNRDTHYSPVSSDSFLLKQGLFPAQPCPIATYCLNGGTCSLYETVGEYVCQCADGYRGQRCEFKDIVKYPAQKALLDYDLNTKMLHSYLSKPDNSRGEVLE